MRTVQQASKYLEFSTKVSRMYQVAISSDKMLIDNNNNIQLYYNKLVVCYQCFMTSSYFSTLTSSCRETDVKAILFTFYDANREY